jgi:hypothetical protein
MVDTRERYTRNASSKKTTDPGGSTLPAAAGRLLLQQGLQLALTTSLGSSSVEDRGALIAFLKMLSFRPGRRGAFSHEPTRDSNHAPRANLLIGLTFSEAPWRQLLLREKEGEFECGVTLWGTECLDRGERSAGCQGFSQLGSSVPRDRASRGSCLHGNSKVRGKVAWS